MQTLNEIIVSLMTLHTQTTMAEYKQASKEAKLAIRKLLLGGLPEMPEDMVKFEAAEGWDLAMYQVKETVKEVTE